MLGLAHVQKHGHIHPHQNDFVQTHSFSQSNSYPSHSHSNHRLLQFMHVASVNTGNGLDVHRNRDINAFRTRGPPFSHPPATSTPSSQGTVPAIAGGLGGSLDGSGSGTRTGTGIKRSAPWPCPTNNQSQFQTPPKRARTAAAPIPRATDCNRCRSTGSNSSSPMKSMAFESPITRYEKVKVLGDGTFGKVWSAREIATNKMYALKQIKMNGQEGFPRTAIREIQIMKKVCHANVLSIREVVWAGEGDCVDAYLVMDLYNFDLHRLVDKLCVRFSSSEIKHLLLQVAKGVSYLHENSLLHRDLKTENRNLKICDFGLSRRFTTKKAYTPVVVTLWYRSPELLLGPVDYSTEVDQWSVGCIFAELVKGYVLFSGNNEAEQIDKIFQITGTPNEQLWPGYSSLPQRKTMTLKTYPNRLRSHFENCSLSLNGYDLLKNLLTLCPNRRISSKDTLEHPYFSEEPAPASSIDMLSKSDYIRYQYHQDLVTERQQLHQAQAKPIQYLHYPLPPSCTQYSQQSQYLQQKHTQLYTHQYPHITHPLHITRPTYSAFPAHSFQPTAQQQPVLQQPYPNNRS